MSLREDVLLRGPWFRPEFGRSFVLGDVLPLLLEGTPKDIEEALHGLVAEGSASYHPGAQTFESTPEGWERREAIVRLRGWRHPALLGKSQADLEELVLAVIAAPTFASRRAHGAYARDGRLPMKALRVYFPENRERAREIASDLDDKYGFVETRAEPGRNDWTMAITPHGERAYLRRLAKYGLERNQTILDEKERHSVRIFSIWQSDYNPSRGHIDEALTTVVGELNSEHRLAVPLEVDTASRLGDGASRIDVTLLERIRSADFVVADITPVAMFDARLVPNSNVLIEVGYALASHAAERVMLVEREARTNELQQANPKARMPFDIDHVNRIVYKSPTALRTRLQAEFEERLRRAGLLLETAT